MKHRFKTIELIIFGAFSLLSLLLGLFVGWEQGADFFARTVPMLLGGAIGGLAVYLFINRKPSKHG